MTPARVATLVACCALACGKSDATTSGQPRAPAAAPLPGKTSWGERPVARVGTGFVTAERLDRAMRMEQQQSSAAGRAPRDRAAVLDELVDEELLVQQAMAKGLLAGDADVRERLIARLIASDGAEAKLRNPTAEELRAFYDQHKAELPQGDMFHVRHILVAVPGAATAKDIDALRKKAERLRGQAAADPDGFAELAKRSSDDPSAARGGDVGRLPADRWALVLGEDFPRVVDSVAAGKVGPVIRSKQGFHIFQIVERTAKDADPLVLHRGEIVTLWQKQARKDRRAALAKRAREEIQVELAPPGP